MDKYTADNIDGIQFKLNGNIYRNPNRIYTIEIDHTRSEKEHCRITWIDEDTNNVESTSYLIRDALRNLHSEHSNWEVIGSSKILEIEDDE